jgi:hypothetical protein
MHGTKHTEHIGQQLHLSVCNKHIYYFVRAHIFSVDFYQHLAFFLCGPSPGTEVIDRLNAHTADQKKMYS